MNNKPESNAKYQRDWYKRNSEVKREAVARRCAENRALINGLKSVPCADCLNSFPPVCMDFDHARGEKSFQISRGWNRSWKSIVAEIEKCDIVCANCHRIRTDTRLRNSADQNVRLLSEMS